MGGALAHDFSVCPGATDQLGVGAVILTPDPIESGQSLTVKMSGTSAIGITGGTANLEVKAFGVKIADLKFDLCKDVGIKCPTTPGQAWTGEITYAIPAEAPAGIKAHAEIKIADAAGAALSCFDVVAKVEKGPKMHSEEVDQFLFTRWMHQHEKQYEVDNFFPRYSIFRDNLKSIADHNAKDLGWTQTMNHFGDLTPDEFHATSKGFNHVNNDFLRSKNLHKVSGKVLANEVDWRTKGAVTPIKNQGQCGSCWAFSTTGSTEGALQIATGKLVSLSEQELVDCAAAEGNQGCNGGLMDNGFQFIINNNGIASEDSYPYSATGGQCHSSGLPVAGDIKGFKDVAKGDENALKDAVSLGPVSVAIEADKLAFQFYHQGVFAGNCGNKLDHGVLVVGYGSENGKDFWIVKNSWGAQWGDQGYIRIARGQDLCGIADCASYPTINAAETNQYF